MCYSFATTQAPSVLKPKIIPSSILNGGKKILSFLDMKHLHIEKHVYKILKLIQKTSLQQQGTPIHNEVQFSCKL